MSQNPNNRNKNRKKRILKHLGNVSIALISVLLAASPAPAIDSGKAGIEAGKLASETMGAKGGKEALNAALAVARSKPAMSTATGIVCIACIPVAGAAASPGLCIACGILLAKTLG